MLLINTSENCLSHEVDAAIDGAHYDTRSGAGRAVLAFGRFARCSRFSLSLPAPLSNSADGNFRFALFISETRRLDACLAVV